MLLLPVLLLQSVQILALSTGNYRGYRKYRKNRFSASKQKETSMTVYPRCKSDVTLLDIIIVDQHGKSAGKSKLWVTSSSGMKEEWANENGQVKTKVTGCEIGIISWTKGKMTKYQQVNLASSEDKTKKVVIQTESSCNFMIRVLGGQFEETQKADRIFYIVTTGGKSISGSFIGGNQEVWSSPLCIPVKDGDSLYMVLTVQSSEFPNILYLSSVREETVAWVTVPYSRVNKHFNLPDLSLMIVSNLWGDSTDADVLPHINPYLIPYVRSDHWETTGEIYGELEENKVYLVTLEIYLRYERTVQGNAVVYDRKENLIVVEYPGGTFTPESTELQDGSIWILGCMRGGSLDTFKEMNKVDRFDSLPRTDSEVPSYCGMNL